MGHTVERSNPALLVPCSCFSLYGIVFCENLFVCGATRGRSADVAGVQCSWRDAVIVGTWTENGGRSWAPAALPRCRACKHEPT